MLKYDDVREDLKTGDIVIFSGKGAVSSFIKLFSGGKWSHVGLVVRLPEFADAVMLWESTTLTNVPDMESGMAVKGVQMVPLSQRMANYDGEVIVRHLSKAVTAEMLTALANTRKKLSRRPYERNELELVRAALDRFGADNREDLSSVFCSELVAEAYQSMGLLLEPPKGLPSNEYTPMDFSESRNDRFKLEKSYKLGPDILIGRS